MKFLHLLLAQYRVFTPSLLIATRRVPDRAPARVAVLPEQGLVSGGGERPAVFVDGRRGGGFRPVASAIPAVFRTNSGSRVLLFLV